MVYDNLRTSILGVGGCGWWAAPYGVISVTGPDARDFLHRMCSQDILGMADGDAAPAAFFNGKGKLIATCVVGIVGDRAWLSCRREIAETLAELLERFHFSEQLSVASHPELGCVEVLGAPESGGAKAASTGVVLSGTRLDTGYRRFHLPETEVAEPSRWNPDGAPALDAAAADAVPYLLRLPLVGVDSEPNTLGLEWGIADHISQTKGCYTGQEIVARIHTYGHTNRRLCLLGIEGTGEIPRGTTLVETEDGDPVGRVMSAVPLPDRSHRLAFGFVPTALADENIGLALGDAAGAPVHLLPWGMSGGEPGAADS